MRQMCACVSLMLIGSLSSGSIHAEDFQIPWTRLREVAQRYLDACVDAKDVKSMEKKLRQRVEQRMQDDDTMGEDVTMRSLMLDWASANGARIMRQEKDAVRQACYYFIIFNEKGYNIPAVISDQLTENAVREINEHLEEQIANKGAAAVKPEKVEKREKVK